MTEASLGVMVVSKLVKDCCRGRFGVDGRLASMPYGRTIDSTDDAVAGSVAIASWRDLGVAAFMDSSEAFCLFVVALFSPKACAVVRAPDMGSRTTNASLSPAVTFSPDAVGTLSWSDGTDHRLPAHQAQLAHSARDRDAIQASHQLRTHVHRLCHLPRPATGAYGLA